MYCSKLNFVNPIIIPQNLHRERLLVSIMNNSARFSTERSSMHHLWWQQTEAKMGYLVKPK